MNCPACGTAMHLASPDAFKCARCGRVEGISPVAATRVAPPAPAAGAPVPARIGKYEILSAVARGGMGVVYKARQPELDRIVALKVISPQLAGQPQFVERFFQEARTLAKLNHPNIVQIYDADRDGDTVYLVMEFVDGRSLRQVLRQRRLSPEDALRIIPPILDALDAAHHAGIVHRDIKPENVLITARGQAKLTDFGLAVQTVDEERRLTATDVVMGTLDYMAPEQRLGAKHVDHRADLYAIGVMLYEMLTGKLPIGRFDPPSALGFDRRLDPVILRSLEQDPTLRYQSASEIRDRISKISSAGTTAPPAPPPAPTAWTAPAPPPSYVPTPAPPPVAYTTTPPPPRGMHPVLIVVLILVGIVVLMCGGLALLGLLTGPAEL